MGTSNTYASFNTIIKGAIDEFNNIHSALQQKGGRNLTGTALSSNGTGTVSSDYSTIILRQFWTVGAANGGEGIISNSSFNGGVGTITNYDGSTLSLTINQTSSYGSSGEVTVTGKVNSHGYFTEGTVFSYTLAGTTLDVSGSLKVASTLWPKDTTTGYFEFTPASNTLLSKVKVREAGVSIGSQGITARNKSISYTQSITNNGSLLIGLNSSTGLGDNPYSFKVNSITRAFAELSADAAVTVQNAGYINDSADVQGVNTATPGVLNISKEIGSGANDISLTGSNEDTIYIKKGSVDVGTRSGGELSITPAAEIVYETSVENTTNYYKIQADVSAFSYPNASISEGYFKDEAITVTGSADQDQIYIAKGSTDNVTVPVSLSVTSNTDNIKVDATTGYSVTISNGQGGSQSATGTVHPGYTNQTEYTASVTGLTKTITLPQADATVSNGTLTVSGVTQSAGVNYLGTGTSDGYALKVKVTMPMTTTISGVGGYLKETSQIHTTALSNTQATNTIYVRKGVGSYTPVLGFELTNAAGDGDSGRYGQSGSGETITLASLFKTTQPTAGDYWTITNSITRNSFTEGYFKEGNETLNQGQTYYLPKAVLEWVDNGDSGEDYIQVTSPGYLPSGILTNISTVEVENASVNAVLSIPSVTVVNSATTNSLSNYPISISKGTIDAGYISAQEGTLALAENYYIKHGAAHVIAVLGTPEVDEFSYNSSAGTYDAVVSGSVSISNSSTFSEGYLKQSDLTTATDNTATTTLSIDKVGMEVLHAALGNNAVKPAMTLNNMTEDANSTFGVTVDLGTLNHNLTPSVSSTGYGATGDTGTNAKLTGTGTINILAATINEKIAGTVGIAISNNFGNNVNGDYTLTTAITPSLAASMNEGYVGSSGMTIGMKENGISLGTVTGTTIAHGNATITGTGSAELTGVTNGLIPAPVIYTAQEAGVSYVKLNAHAGVSTTRTSFKEGYIKQTDLTLNNVAGDTPYYIQLVSQNYNTTTSVLDSDNLAYTQEIEVDTELPIAEQYTDKDFLITIGPNAAGSTVQTHLEALQKRMAGTLTLQEYAAAFSS